MSNKIKYLAEEPLEKVLQKVEEQKVEQLKVEESALIYNDFLNLTFEEFCKTIKVLKTIENFALTKKALTKAFEILESNENRVAEIYMNARCYSSLRLFDRNILDVVTQGNLMLQGVMASIWGAQIIVSRKVPDNTVLVLSDIHFRTASILKINNSNKKDEIIREFKVIKSRLHELQVIVEDFESLI